MKRGVSLLNFTDFKSQEETKDFASPFEKPMAMKTNLQLLQTICVVYSALPVRKSLPGILAQFLGNTRDDILCLLEPEID